MGIEWSALLEEENGFEVAGNSLPKVVGKALPRLDCDCLFCCHPPETPLGSQAQTTPRPRTGEAKPVEL